jgi:hypothetical protein
MASLTITVGALTASVSASNAKAAAVLQNFATAKEFTGTDQEKLDQVVNYLGGVLTGVSRSYAAMEAVRAAQAEAGSDDSISWSD